MSEETNGSDEENFELKTLKSLQNETIIEKQKIESCEKQITTNEFDDQDQTSEKMGTIVEYRNKYLGVWQKQSRLFSFPKRGRKINESPEECAKRELEEETGILLPLSDYHKSSTTTLVFDQTKNNV